MYESAKSKGMILGEIDTDLRSIKLPPISTTATGRTTKTNADLTVIKKPKFIFKNTALNPHDASTINTTESTISFNSKHFSIKQPQSKKRIVQSLELNKGSLGPTPDIKELDNEYFRKRLNTPIRRELVQSEDELPLDIVGYDIYSKYHHHYKKLDRIRELNDYIPQEPSVYTNFLSKSETLKLLPSKVGFLKPEGKESALEIAHYRIGDKYAEVISEGLRSVKSFKKFDLQNNRIGTDGAEILLKSIHMMAESMNLANNKIGPKGCISLANVLNSSSCKLVELNLENNKLTDDWLDPLFEGLEVNKTVKKLNLSNNLITDNGAKKIGRMVEFNVGLNELYLRWNKIKGAGGSEIFNGLKKSAGRVKVLDLSWNFLGHDTVFAKTFADFVRTDENLLHLDISFNSIGEAETKIISEALNSNHTLYGLHYAGNFGYVDPKGFLIPNHDYLSPIAIKQISPPITGVSKISEAVKKHTESNGEYRDVCWICEGWKQHTFEWTTESGPIMSEPVYVHLSYEGYKDRYLPKAKNFTNERMIPPISFTYFYSIEHCQVVALDKEKHPPKDPIIHFTIEDQNLMMQMEEVNVFPPSEDTSSVIDPITYLVKVSQIPRDPDAKYIPPEKEIEVLKWIFPMSVFKEFRQDTPEILQKCLAVDFENTRIPKLVKNPDDLEPIKKIFEANYPKLFECYKYYSAMGVSSGVWNITLNPYTDFCKDSGIIDEKLLLTKDFDRIFIATYTKTDKTKNFLNPDRALVRYQFLEGIFRLAEQKYLSNGVVSTQREALETVFKENVTPYISTYDVQKWRFDRLWNEECDTIIKSYLPVFKGVYREFSKEKVKPSEKPFMCLEEFQRLVKLAGFESDKCGERDALLSFRYAMMTQIDELNSKRITEMSFIEFIEAVSRILDIYSPPPYLSTETLSYDTRKNQHLSVKLEGAIPALFSCCGNDVKNIYILPEKSIWEMEAVSGKIRFPTKKRKILRVDPTNPASHNPYD